MPMKKRLFCASIAALLPFAALAADEVTPIDPVTGKVLVAPGDSILAEDITSGPPNPKPPPYTLLRYTEHYSYLADPAKHTDFFDPVKYIPLDSGNKESYLSLGGEIRERFEHYNNQAFGVKGPDENDYLLQRITLHGDLHVNERLRFFAQAISGIQDGGKDGYVSANNQNPLELQQAFADYTFGDPTQNGTRLTLRGGRFGMTFGSGRLVATRSAPNIPFKFDGFETIGSMNGTSKIYTFITHPDRDDKHELDPPDHAQMFDGVYTSTPLGGPLNTSIDLYYLGYRNERARYVDGTGVEDRHTVGTRLFGKVSGWDYDIEPVVQFGEVGNNDIRAWTIATDGGYSFADALWKPRIGTKFDIASGDSKRGDGKIESFNPLFFKAGYFNDASLLRPSNIVDIHPSVQLQPGDATTVTLGSDVIWRYSTQDGIYSPGGGITLPAGGSPYVGTSAEAAIQYQLDRHIVLTGSYVHLFSSDYVKSAGGGDVDYLATWVTFTW